MTTTILAPSRGEERLEGTSATYRKIAWRLLPFLMLCYIAAYLDRINVGFAKLHMLKDLGLSEAVYGLGAGLFFIGYLLFEVPSNLIMMRVGARKTISRIMVLWSLISAGFAFVQTPLQFYVLRFLLGAAEAGFFPGVILYLSYWFPAQHRAKMMAVFIGAIPLAGMIGAPVSGLILERAHGMGEWAGWQWLFIIEAVPSLLLGLACLLFLHDSPSSVPWLSSDEKRQVQLDVERGAAQAGHLSREHSVLATFRNSRVWHMTLIVFCQAMCTYGVSFWLPTLVQQLNVGDAAHVGYYTAIPFTAAFVMINLVGRSSDRNRERRWHLAVPFLCACFGFLGSIFFKGSVPLAMFCLSAAAAGAYTAVVLCFAIPSLFLSGVGMATGLALINSVGGLGGFLSPSMVGWVKEATGRTDYGVLVIAGAALLGALLTLALPKKLVNR